MGGKRIAEQVRRALITAAKTVAVAGAIDAVGCHRLEPVAECPCDCLLDAAGQGGAPGTGGKRGFLPDAGKDATSDASTDGG
jgi:hypothetical protein